MRVGASPPHLPFYVDGQYFQAPAAFFWPAGSRHVLSTLALNVGTTPGTRYVFKQWLANNVELQQKTPEVVVAADPAISQFQAVFGTQYLLRVSFAGCTDAALCEPTGSVFMEGNRLTENTDVWVDAGKAVKLEAVPNAGYVCVGWQAPYSEAGFTATVVMNGPMTVTPRFVPAQRVRLETSPPGLKLMADRTLATAPVTLDWGYDTTHTLSPVTPQGDSQSRVWVFSRWSDGAPATRAYKVPVGDRETVLTAEFVPGARVTFTTSPPGLKLMVDGRDNWYGSYSFSWGVGETHGFEAPAEQMDQNGRKWVFRGWSNGGAAAQEIAVTQEIAASGLRLNAEYELLGRLTLEASTGGVAATVDGVTCALPCTLHRPAGSQARISVPGSIPAGDDARFDFASWSDAGATALRSVTFDADARVLSAGYRLMNRLAVSADPAGGAVFRCQPESTDGFYEAGATVALAVESRPGFRFRRFEGDLTGSFTSGVLAMSAPRWVRAVFERVPYIAPAGVRNAAAETPVPAVAPGSAISIYGANLAEAVELGPESPLAQAIGGITVRLGDRVLPLFFVSPEQINAQLPSDLEAGDHTLEVWRENRAKVSAAFTAARNAPGLFQSVVEDRAWAVALHEDGSPVTPQSPARRGEVLTVYGTGFGPTDPRTLDGFAVPGTPEYRLQDPAEIVAGETTLQPLWIGLAPGRVGVNAFRFPVAPALPSGALTLKLRVNGAESNSVLLAVE